MYQKLKNFFTNNETQKIDILGRPGINNILVLMNAGAYTWGELIGLYLKRKMN